MTVGRSRCLTGELWEGRSWGHLPLALCGGSSQGARSRAGPGWAGWPSHWCTCAQPALRSGQSTGPQIPVAAPGLLGQVLPRATRGLFPLGCPSPWPRQEARRAPAAASRTSGPVDAGPGLCSSGGPAPAPSELRRSSRGPRPLCLRDGERVCSTCPGPVPTPTHHRLTRSWASPSGWGQPR